ncbi:BrnT family toxin [Labrys okinawensis]|uniref:BrnT family toxin n=1 Tax=Labrys okinawensis TaxID=346911 RepID=UPI0039BC2D3F
MKTRYEWDSTKADTNLRKHGVSFDIALRVFADPFALMEQDRIEEGEQRWQTLGWADNYMLLLVAHTLWEEEEDGSLVEVIRIISARAATRKERRRYEQQGR